MKKFLLAFVLLFGWLSCKKSDMTTTCGCSPITVSLHLTVRDNNGRDLLPSFNKDSIRITHVKGAKAEAARFYYEPQRQVAGYEINYDRLILPDIFYRQGGGAIDYTLITLSPNTTPDTLRIQADNETFKSVTINSRPAALFSGTAKYEPVYTVQK